MLKADVATLDGATSGAIAFLANPRYRHQLRSTGASAVIIDSRFAADTELPKLVVDDAPWIFVDNAFQNAAGAKKVAGFKLHPSFYLFFDKISVAP